MNDTFVPDWSSLISLGEQIALFPNEENLVDGYISVTPGHSMWGKTAAEMSEILGVDIFYAAPNLPYMDDVKYFYWFGFYGNTDDQDAVVMQADKLSHQLAAMY